MRYRRTSRFKFNAGLSLTPAFLTSVISGSGVLGSCLEPFGTLCLV